MVSAAAGPGSSLEMFGRAQFRYVSRTNILWLLWFGSGSNRFKRQQYTGLIRQGGGGGAGVGGPPQNPKI